MSNKDATELSKLGYNLLKDRFKAALMPYKKKKSKVRLPWNNLLKLSSNPLFSKVKFALF